MGYISEILKSNESQFRQHFAIVLGCLTVASQIRGFGRRDQGNHKGCPYNSSGIWAGILDGQRRKSQVFRTGAIANSGGAYGHPFGPVGGDAEAAGRGAGGQRVSQRAVGE